MGWQSEGQQSLFMKIPYNFVTWPSMDKLVCGMTISVKIPNNFVIMPSTDKLIGGVTISIKIPHNFVTWPSADKLVGGVTISIKILHNFVTWSSVDKRHYTYCLPLKPCRGCAFKLKVAYVNRDKLVEVQGKPYLYISSAL